MINKKRIKFILLGVSLLALSQSHGRMETEIDSGTELKTEVPSLSKTQVLEPTVQEYRKSIAPEVDLSEDWSVVESAPTTPAKSCEIANQDKVGGFTLQEVMEMAYFCDVAYVDVGAVGSRHLQLIEDLQLTGHKVTFFGTPAENSGLVIEKPNGEVIVAYHGTNSLRNVASDAWFTWAMSDKMHGRFHNGFLNGFQQTQMQVLEILNSIGKRQGKKLNEMAVRVTGHSMGAALAGIMAKWLDEVEHVQNLKAALIACPRFVDVVGAKDYQDRSIGKNTVVVREEVDPVAKVTPGFLGAQHVGEKLTLPKLHKDWAHCLGGYQRGLAILDQANAQNQGQGVKGYKFEADKKGGIASNPQIQVTDNTSIPNPFYAARQANIAFQENVMYPVHKAVKKAKDDFIAGVNEFGKKLKNFFS